MIKADALREVANNATTLEKVEEKICRDCLCRAQKGLYNTYVIIPIQYAETVISHLTDCGYDVKTVQMDSDRMTQSIEVRW